jgi:outer membrane murein-binding lipoprotein Lpp
VKRAAIASRTGLPRSDPKEEEMKKTMTAVLMMIGALLLGGGILFAQSGQTSGQGSSIDKDIELLRQDVRSQKKQIVAANMTLTDAEAQKFWPVYDQYTAELRKLGDTRVALIKQYAQNYDTFTDAQANDLLQKWGALDGSVAQLRLQYAPIFEKVISAKKTALFFQIDRRVGLMIDLQLASQIPLVQP